MLIEKLVVFQALGTIEVLVQVLIVLKQILDIWDHNNPSFVCFSTIFFVLKRQQ